MTTSRTRLYIMVALVTCAPLIASLCVSQGQSEDIHDGANRTSDRGKPGAKVKADSHDPNAPTSKFRTHPIHVPPLPYKPLAESAESLKGKSVFNGQNCAACHSIAGEGGCLAPPLDGIGARRTRQFIQSRITDDPVEMKEFEKLYPQQELLPHPRLPASEARAVTEFLLTLAEPKGGFRLTAHNVKEEIESKSKVKPAAGRGSKIKVERQNPDDVAAGKTLFNDRGCLACHSIGNVGGHFAPRLDGIGQRRGKQYIVDRISAAEFLTDTGDEYEGRGNPMPPTDLDEKQVQQVASFLMTVPESR